MIPYPVTIKQEVDNVMTWDGMIVPRPHHEELKELVFHWEAVIVAAMT